MASFIPNFSSLQNSDSTELKPEKNIQNYRVKILEFASFFFFFFFWGGGGFTVCNAVELSHKKSNFATPK